MKPIKSLIAAITIAINMCISVGLITTATTNAQAQDSFADVAAGNWAYRAITDLQKTNILIGYPDGFFNGKRVLTRYEFALAIKRAIETMNLAPPTPSAKIARPEAFPGAQQISLDQVQSLKRLAEEFSKDLIGLQVNVRQVNLRLDAIAGQLNAVPIHIGTAAKPGIELYHELQFELPRSVFSSNLGLYGRTPLVTDGVTPLNAFNVTARIGSATASLFASGLGSTNLFTGDIFDRAIGGTVAAPLAFTPTMPDSVVTPLTQSGTIANRFAGLHVTAPLFNSGTVGGTVLDFSNPAGATQPNGNTLVGGINFNLNPIGRVNVSGEASRSVSQLDPGADPDNSAFNLNVRYNSGPVGVLGGFQYIDPGYDAPGEWNRIGVLSNLTNVQGPFLRVNYTLNPRTQFQVGSDLLEGARNRSYNFGGGLTTGFGTHDYISTLSAGLQYKLWHSASLTADWQGVYWDLSAASSGIGAESHPFESYINLGTGFNLRGNAMLKMGYQIGTFGNFSGLGGLGPSGSGQTYNAFTTTLNVKF